MSALVDTNVLVYRYDPREPAKQRAAISLLRMWAYAEHYDSMQSGRKTSPTVS